VETCKPTSHENPAFIVDDVVHYCVANMPGAVPCTSTIALTNSTLPYALQLADKGWQKACADNGELKKGLNVVRGKVVYKAVSDAFGLEFTGVESVLSEAVFA
jgi:alanine dehydrogenase